MFSLVWNLQNLRNAATWNAKEQGLQPRSVLVLVTTTPTKLVLTYLLTYLLNLLNLLTLLTLLNLLYFTLLYFTYLLTYLLTHSLTHSLSHSLTHSMENNTSWEANRFSGSREIPCIFLEPDGSLPHSQEPATCAYPESDRSRPYPNIPLPEAPS
jgi:hypothetical protein